MTDRLKGCIVVFENDIREDDAESILNAIQMIKGVQSVAKSVCNMDDWMNRERVRSEMTKKLFEVVTKK